MKKERNELLEFLGGLVMLVTGLFLFTNRVTVQSSLFYGTFVIGSVKINSVLVFIPFIVGIVLMFIKPRILAGKLTVGFGLILIVAAIILSTTIRLPRIAWYEWILYIVLIFGGLAFLCRALFASHSHRNDKDNFEGE